MRKPTIIAMGGGGFSMEPENPLLDEYVLSLTGKKRPSVCFVPTASGDAEGYVERFHAAFAERADTAVLRLFRRSEADLAAFVAGQDVVYVGGGNTANMLAVWRIHGLDATLRSAWRRGTILCGLSAGALCWFAGGVTDSFGERLAPLHDGLGLLPGSFCPHYDGKPLRRPAFERLVQQRELAEGWVSRVALADRPWFGQTDRPIETNIASRFGAGGVSAWVGQTDRIHRYAAASETPVGTARFRLPPGGFR